MAVINKNASDHESEAQAFIPDVRINAKW